MAEQGFRWTGTLVFLGLGALCGRWLGAGVAEPRPPGATAFWVADRGADRVYGLDRDLLFTASITVLAPIRLAPAPGGGIYVLSARDRDPGGRHVLRRLGSGGSVIWERDLGPIRDLVPWEAGLVLVEGSPNPDGAARVIAIRPLGELELLAVGDVQRVARAGGRFLLGLGDGLLQLWATGESAPAAELDLEGALMDLAAVRGGQGWLALSRVGGAGTRIAAFDPDLTLKWSRDVAPRATSLLHGGSESARFVGREGSTLWSFGRSPDRDHQIELDLPSDGRGLALPGGGLIWVTPGALLRFRADGSALPGQGGFGFLVDMVAVNASRESGR